MHATRYTFFEYLPGHGFIVLYPFLSWLGIMLMGYGFGRFFLPDVSALQRKRLLVVTGLLMISIFVIVRLLNGYGNPRPWESHSHWAATFGYPLGVVYLIWIGIVALLYPLCRRYAAYKKTHRQWWLSYI